MREHLYQGKRLDNGEWVEGYYSPVNLPLAGNMGHFINEGGFRAIEVDPDTISEFTGLRDKNGKRIFEGYVVKAEVGLDEYIGIVKYDEERAMFLVVTFDRNKAKHTDKLCLGCEYITEVIGNKWDNPELLKGGAA